MSAKYGFILTTMGGTARYTKEKNKQEKCNNCKQGVRDYERGHR
jgi:hypothetical protein